MAVTAGIVSRKEAGMDEIGRLHDELDILRSDCQERDNQIDRLYARLDAVTAERDTLRDRLTRTIAHADELADTVRCLRSEADRIVTAVTTDDLAAVTVDSPAPLPDVDTLTRHRHDLLSGLIDVEARLDLARRRDAEDTSRRVSEALSVMSGGTLTWDRAGAGDRERALRLVSDQRIAKALDAEP